MNDLQSKHPKSYSTGVVSVKKTAHLLARCAVPTVSLWLYILEMEGLKSFASQVFVTSDRQTAFTDGVSLEQQEARPF
jgi:hypothetical protein